MSEYPKEVEWKKPDTKNTLFHLFKIQKLRKLIGGDRVKIVVTLWKAVTREGTGAGGAGGG